MFVDELRHFLSAIERKEPSCIPIDDGIAVLELALRAKQSGREAHDG
jgi:predicted dehydrogenase